MILGRFIPGVGPWIASALMNLLAAGLSRKDEYEADAFARDAMGSYKPLSEALRELHKENLSNLTPHPIYSNFHYSHPTLLEREEALRQPSTN
jgi:STE24 endopeptidase